MRRIKFNSFKSTVLLSILAVSAVFSSCTEEVNPSDSSYPAWFVLGPIHVIRFTDNEDFRSHWPEQLNVTGDEQTLTLRILALEVDENDRDELLAKIDTMYFYIHEWIDGQKHKKFPN